MTLTPFKMVEKAVKELIETKYPIAEGKVGGDPSYEVGDDLYVWISLVGGSTTEIDGQWFLDIDVFAPSYGAAMDHALALEALLLARRHVTSVMRLDSTFQNEAPADRPWEEDGTFRIGASYGFTARRSG